MKRSYLVGLLAVLLIAAVIAGGLLLRGRAGTTLPDPRPLIPESTGIYAQFGSLPRIKSFGAEMAELAPQLMLLKQFFASNYSLVDKVLAAPEQHGIDLERPVAFAVLYSPTDAPVIAYIPIKDVGALAASFKKTEEEIAGAPAVIEGYHAALRDGYLVVASSAELVAMPAAGKDEILSLPASSDAVLTVVLLPEMLKGADAALESVSHGTNGMAQFGMLMLRRSIANILGGALVVDWTEQGFRINSSVDLKDGSEILALFENAEGEPAFLDYLPQSPLVAGVRINPAAVTGIAGSMLAELSKIIDDSSALELFEMSAAVPVTQSGIAMDAWSMANPTSSLLNIVRIPSGTEDTYVAVARAGQEKSGKMWESMMKSSGHANSSMKTRSLPDERHREIAIHGFEMKMTLDIEIPEGAPKEMRESLEKYRHQTQVSRYAVIPGDRFADSESADAGRYSYVVISTSAEPEGIRGGIDRALERAPSAAEHPAFAGLLAAARPGFAYLLCDPIGLSFTGEAARDSAPMAIFARRDGNSLRADLTIPRASISALINASTPEM